MSPWEILPNDNPKEREGRNGRITVSHRRTWILVVQGHFHGEYHLRREALAAIPKEQP